MHAINRFLIYCIFQLLQNLSVPVVIEIREYKLTSDISISKWISFFATKHIISKDNHN